MYLLFYSHPISSFPEEILANLIISSAYCFSIFALEKDERGNEECERKRQRETEREKGERKTRIEGGTKTLTKVHVSLIFSYYQI